MDKKRDKYTDCNKHTWEKIETKIIIGLIISLCNKNFQRFNIIDLILLNNL